MCKLPVIKQESHRNVIHSRVTVFNKYCIFEDCYENGCSKFSLQEKHFLLCMMMDAN